jgi:MFS family permease
MAIYSYFPPYLLALGYNKLVVQLIVTIFPLTSAIFPPIIGKFSDKIQKRYVFFLFGGIGLTLVFILLSLFMELILIVILLFVFGFMSASFGIIFILYQELVLNDQKYISYYNAMIVLGWFIGAQFGGLFIDLFRVKPINLFLLIFGFLVLISCVLIKEDRDLILSHQEKTFNKTDLIKHPNTPERSTISKSIYVSLFFRNFGTRPLVSILAILMAFHITSDAGIGFLIGFNPLIQFFLMIITGKFISTKNEKMVMAIGYILSAISVLGYWLSIDFFGFLICQILISFSYALFWNATQIYLAQRTTPLNKGKYIGYSNMSFYFGSFFGGLFYSSLLLFNPDYYATMWIMIFFPLISSAVILIKFKN